MSTAKETKYLFIDGACLENILTRIGKEFFNGDTVDFNYVWLGHGYDKVFYYDALPKKSKSESEDDFKVRLAKKEEFLNKLKIQDKFHVYEGVVLERREQLNQKAVDIMIAVDMLRHSFRKNMDKATLLTGDLDFKPLLDALVLEGMYTTLWYDPRITSKELLFAADSNHILSLSSIYSHTSESFKANHPAPEIKHGGYEQYSQEYGHIIGNGFLNSGTISVYSSENGANYFILYYVKDYGPRFAIYPDKGYLVRWFEYEFNGKVNWE